MKSKAKKMTPSSKASEVKPWEEEEIESELTQEEKDLLDLICEGLLKQIIGKEVIYKPDP